MGPVECMDPLFHHCQLHSFCLGSHLAPHWCQANLVVSEPDVQQDDSYEMGGPQGFYAAT